MQEYFLQNLGELAHKRAIGLRDEAQLWDILARDLAREAGRRKESPAARQVDATKPAEAPAQKTEQRDAKRFVRIPEAARMMGIGRSSLYNEINASRIKVRKAGKKTLIAVADIQAWFDGLPEGGNG